MQRKANCGTPKEISVAMDNFTFNVNAVGVHWVDTYGWYNFRTNVFLCWVKIQ